ncbi:uncharacterized protein LOC131306675 [Rhododendron vialii]|uniref:uncharacterized protein LOC131306675 n=1 Tax=Rhododendron vialii TaxID=182163 RepID=UPI00265DC991|nr:uncharacterized protein LOC131306675 [Rhododendron vialii]
MAFDFSRSCSLLINKEMDEIQGLDCLGQDEISRRHIRQRQRYARFTPTQRAEYIQKTMQNRKRKCNAHYTSPNTNHGCELSDGQTQNPSPHFPLEDNLMHFETIGQRLREVHLSQPHYHFQMEHGGFSLATGNDASFRI